MAQKLVMKSKKAAGKAQVKGKTLSIQEELSALQEKWAGAEAKPQYAEVPDGDYSVVVSSAVVNRSKTSGRLQVVWDLVISDGDFENWHLWKYDGLEGDQSLDWLMTSLGVLEADQPESLSDLPDVLEACAGKEVSVNVRTKQGFQNVYFRELLGEVKLEEEEGKEEGKEEGEEEEVDLDKMTKEELAEFADANGVEYPEKVTTSKLRELIYKALA